jgi:hypothetical protein
MLNADNWAETSTSLLQSQAIRSATANFVVDQLYANVDVSGQIKSALPPRLKPLAGPISGAVRNGAVTATERALARPLVQNLWRAANRAADQALITIVRGGNRHLTVANGEVTLNLRPIIEQAAARLGLPSGIGAKLPPTATRLVILKAKQIKLVQDIGNGLRGLALALSIIVPLLYIVAIGIARDRRRRTLLSVGISGVVAGLVVILFRRIIVTAVVNSLVKDDSIRAAAHDTVAIATSVLSEIAGAAILIAAVLIVCAWFAGPSRFATPARRWIAPFLRGEPAGVYAIVAAVLLIIFIWQPIPATSKPIGMIVFAVLAAIGAETLRRQVGREFPVADDTHRTLTG